MARYSGVGLHLKHGLVVLVEGRNSPVDSMTGFITTQPTDAPERSAFDINMYTFAVG